jgi:hypothetical protein
MVAPTRVRISAAARTEIAIIAVFENVDEDVGECGVEELVEELKCVALEGVPDGQGPLLMSGKVTPAD